LEHLLFFSIFRNIVFCCWYMLNNDVIHIPILFTIISR
jgi:hypothetical protein